ncbi:hypothetical protein JCM19037_1706 [Geomicrobium sp. JCM 19037]|uniref:hypothetical protein n=1 Tax=unclassified Geomicrobium TaxID=2628951 RepID=UPI00045F1FDD|nr:hypothetical protein [Geomicrobium sp. JCM 19037]GAK03384.1 hypothetical protein JCM19037_1706 [Geomicrobium sp. JCM 19037]
MKKTIFLLLLVLVGVGYCNRHRLLNRLLMNETRRRVLIKLMMEIPAFRKYMMKRYSPFRMQQ